MICEHGMLSGDQLRIEMQQGNILICPFEKSQLTPLGYNLTASDFVFSTRRNILLDVKSNNSERYVEIPAGDTALVLSREYISVSSSIAGTFHSRVRTVSSGFGHISTTLDPEWRGPLLIALNNPSNQKRRFVLRSQTGKGVKYNEFCTMVLQYIPPNNSIKHDNLPFRFDILEQYYLSNPWSKKANNPKTIFFHNTLKIISDAVDKVTWVTDNAVRYEDLNNYLEKIITEYCCNGDENVLYQKVLSLDLTYVDIQTYGSEIFTHQYQNAIQIATNLDSDNMAYSEQEDDDTCDVNHLVDALRVLEQQCYREIQMLRWNAALSQLESEFDAYRIGWWSQVRIWGRGNVTALTLTALLVFAAILSLALGSYLHYSWCSNLAIPLFSAALTVFIGTIVQKSSG